MLVYAKSRGSPECPKCWACKKFVEDLSECASWNSQRQNFSDYQRPILTLDAFEAFVHGSIFNQTVFCLVKQQHMLVNKEYNSWYNRVDI